jgi:hypothetical protein
MDVPPDDIDTWMAAQAKAQHASEIRGEDGPVLPDATAAMLPVATAMLPAPMQGGAR